MHPTVFFVDDNELVRDVVCMQLEAVGFSVAPYCCAEDFLAAFSADQPGCLLLDLTLPGLGGLELQKRLAADGCTLPIVFLSGTATIGMAVEAIQGGAFAFLMKPVNGEVLIERIRAALREDDRRRQQRMTRRAEVDRVSCLTPREREIMDLIALGQTSKAIADRLGISKKTVDAHRARIMLKTRTANVADLVRLSLATLDERQMIQRSLA